MNNHYSVPFFSSLSSAQMKGTIWACEVVHRRFVASKCFLQYLSLVLSLGHAQSRSMNDITDTPSTDQVVSSKSLLWTKIFCVK